MMKEIVLAQKLEADEILSSEYVERTATSKFKKTMDTGLVKVITGARRAGKSFFALQILKNEKFGYVNFDDERITKVKDYDEIIKAVKAVHGDVRYILFDEIQNLSDWELFVNRLHRRKFNIIITGSNSRLLSTELATHLTGRHLNFQIFPFSFREFLIAKKFEMSRNMLILKEYQGEILRFLSEYLEKGGFPEIVVKNLDYRSYLKTLFENVIFKDIVKRYNIRFSNMIYELGRYLVTNFSKEFTFTRLKHILNFGSVHTVENYFRYLEETFLVFHLDRFSYKLKEQLKSSKKVYCIDNGLANAVSFRFSIDEGRLYENIVGIELFKEVAQNHDTGLYYWKDSYGKEVDFVIKQGLKIKQLVQICYNIDDYETRKRELRALLKASEELKCNNLLVITEDYDSIEKYNNKKIKFIPLWKWLLLRL